MNVLYNYTVFEVGMGSFWQNVLRRDTHPAVQFFKYAFIGGLATGINIGVFFICGWLLFPCLTESDIIVRLTGLSVTEIPPGLRATRAACCNALGFVISNIVCYILNRIFVFEPGRHHWVKEFILFFAASAGSWVIGTAIQTLLIMQLDIQTTLAFGANIIVALLFNYTMRKYVVFKG